MSTLPCSHSEIVVKWITLSFKIKILFILIFIVLCADLIILPFPRVVIIYIFQ